MNTKSIFLASSAGQRFALCGTYAVIWNVTANVTIAYRVRVVRNAQITNPENATTLLNPRMYAMAAMDVNQKGIVAGNTNTVPNVHRSHRTINSGSLEWAFLFLPKR